MLKKRKGALKKKKRGHLKLNIEMRTEGNTIVLSCEVLSATNLLPADISGLADPYVKMYVQPDPSKKTKQKTKVGVGGDPQAPAQDGSVSQTD